MARRVKHEEHENHERWLVSYADFITLLFAFFVVMYSISSVNEGKYRVLSNAIVSAFSQPAKTIEPIQQGSPLRAPIIQHQVMPDDEAEARVGVDHQVMPSVRDMANMQKIADEVENKLKDLVDKELVNIYKTTKGVEIEIKSSILYKSGSANLEHSAKDVLRKIAAIVKNLPNSINVEGFTDNIPIRTLMFRSNWELSAARAASVVHLFTDSEIDPQRLAAIGYGEFQPIASNDTEDGRSKNRRVSIIVLNAPDERRKRLPGEEKRQENTLGNAINKSIINAIATPGPEEKSGSPVVIGVDTKTIAVGESASVKSNLQEKLAPVKQESPIKLLKPPSLIQLPSPVPASNKPRTNRD